MPLYPATLQHMPPPVPANTLLKLGQDVHQGLKHMHSAKLAHCDVKAPNIFITSGGDACLGDYGAARQLGSDADEKTLSHIAKDLPAAFAVDTASAHLDEYLLAVTLLDRHGVLQLHRVEQGRLAGFTVADVHKAVEDIRDGPDVAPFKAFITSLLEPLMP